MNTSTRNNRGLMARQAGDEQVRQQLHQDLLDLHRGVQGADHMAQPGTAGDREEGGHFPARKRSGVRGMTGGLRRIRSRPTRISCTESTPSKSTRCSRAEAAAPPLLSLSLLQPGIAGASSVVGCRANHDETISPRSTFASRESSTPEHVDGADKLLRLTLDVGDGRQRTVFAGIKSACVPEDLIGRLTPMVANLAPRKMKFGLSEEWCLRRPGRPWYLPARTRFRCAARTCASNDRYAGAGSARSHPAMR